MKMIRTLLATVLCPALSISIQAKVQPLLNQRQAKALELKLKPFFLRVAKVLP